jgi:hypothetical protein
VSYYPQSALPLSSAHHRPVLGEERQPAWQQHPLVQQTYVRPYPRTSYDRTTSYETYASGSRYGPSLDPTEALELTQHTTGTTISQGARESCVRRGGISLCGSHLRRGHTRAQLEHQQTVHGGLQRLRLVRPYVFLLFAAVCLSLILS